MTGMSVNFEKQESQLSLTKPRDAFVQMQRCN